MKSILCFGDVTADVLIPFGAANKKNAGAEIPPEQLEVEITEGGSIGNTAFGLGRLNVPTMFCGTAGNDRYGRMLRDGLKKVGVDTSLLRLDDNISTMMVLIVVDEIGERITFAVPKRKASQHAILPEQIPADITDRISLMHSTGMTLREDPAASVQLELMRACHEKNIPVSIDINCRMESYGDEFLRRKLEQIRPYCSIVLGSKREEIPLFAGIADPDEAAAKLAQEGKTVVMRDGSNGAVVYHGNEVTHCPAFPVTMVDAVGAGDAYNAGFLYALHNGHAPSVANRIACATAAVCVSCKGGRACPSTQELDAFLQSFRAGATD